MSEGIEQVRSGDGLTELIRQHRRLRELLADLVDHTRALERERYPDGPDSLPLDRACIGLATLEWRMPE